LQVAPSTYDAARLRRRQARPVRDEEPNHEIARIHGEGCGLYGAGKLGRARQRGVSPQRHP